MSAAAYSVQPMATLQMQLVDTGRELVRALPNLAIAIVIVLLIWLVARLSTRIAHVLTGRPPCVPVLKI